MSTSSVSSYLLCNYLPDDASLLMHRWNVAVEYAIGNMMNRYICTSKKDTQQLRSLLLQHGLNNTSIYTANLNTPLHNIPADRLPGPNWTSIMDVLEVSGRKHVRKLAHRLLRAVSPHHAQR